ncbi:MAG: hypothetical protein EAZ92_04720 [Candidatus Kapaibacterium sp.]|nr:MAG: hypothetical protein EAZ92_04720 [Candidatus Kapabacteria bacterium]
MNKSFKPAQILIFALFLGSFATSILRGQNEQTSSDWANQVRFKLFGGVAANQHQINAPELTGYPIFTPRDSFNAGPANFQTTVALGWWGGIGVDVPLANTLALSLAASAQPHNVLLTTSEQTRVGTLTGTSIDARIGYVYDIRLLAAGLDALLAWRPIESAGLSICAGARGAWLVERRITQREELLEPNFGGFTPSGERVRNLRQEMLESAQQLQVHALGALRYDAAIPLQGAWLLISPEIQVGYPITRITRQDAWQLAFARAGIAIGFAARPEPKVEPVVYPPLPPGYTAPSSKQ